MIKIYYKIVRELGFREAVIYGLLEYRVKYMQDLPYHPATSKKKLIRLKKAGYIKRLKLIKRVGLSYKLIPPEDKNYVRLKEYTKEQFLYWTLIKLQYYTKNQRYNDGIMSNKELMDYMGFSVADLRDNMKSLEDKHLIKRDFNLGFRVIIPLKGVEQHFEQPKVVQKHKYYDLIDFQIKPLKAEVPILKKEVHPYSAVGDFWDKKLSEFSAEELESIDIFNEYSFIKAFKLKGLDVKITSMDKGALKYYHPDLVSWFGKFTLRNLIDAAYSIASIFEYIYKRSNIKSMTWQTLIAPYNQKKFYNAIERKLSDIRNRKKRKDAWFTEEEVLEIQRKKEAEKALGFLGLSPKNKTDIKTKKKRLW